MHRIHLAWVKLRTVIPMDYAPGDSAPAQLRAHLAAASAQIEIAVLELAKHGLEAQKRVAEFGPQ